MLSNPRRLGGGYAEIDLQPPAGLEPPPRVEEPVPQPALTAAAMMADDEL